MYTGMIDGGLRLTEEEAFALLGLALTSPQKLDAYSEAALKKLADYCANNSHSLDLIEAHGRDLSQELTTVGA